MECTQTEDDIKYLSWSYFSSDIGPINLESWCTSTKQCLISKLFSVDVDIASSERQKNFEIHSAALFYG